MRADRLLSVLEQVRSARRIRVEADVVQSDGWREMHVSFDSPREAGAFVLSQPDGIQLLAPAEVRQELASAAAKALRRYGSARRARHSARSRRIS